MPDIMSQSRGERLIQLYQYLPRGEKNAKTLSELLTLFNPTGEKAKSRVKLLEQDLQALYALLGDHAICRMPSWIDGSVAGKTPKYYLHPNFTLDNYDNENLFFWEMLDRFTANYLPKEMHKKLVEKIANIQNHHNKQYQASQLGQWKNHLISLPSLLHAPQYKDDVIKTIQQAMMEGKRLKIRYRGKWQDNAYTLQVYPAGLVFQDNMIYLTGFYDVADSIKASEHDYLAANRNFAVTRIESASLLDEAIPNWVKDFSLDSLLTKGALETHLSHRGQPIELQLKINHCAAKYINERPLSDNQTLEKIDDEYLLLTATVMNSLRLEDWLVSMSHMSEVLKPQELRDNVIERLKNGLAYYER